MSTLEPSTEAEVVEAAAAAIASQTPLAIVGGGTGLGLGRPMVGQALNLSKLSGITLYEPAELVMGARAGTPVAEIEEVLAGRGQMLPFEPMDLRPLHASSGSPSIGGVFAANLSGPRRVAAGAARDHLLGVTFVNGRAQPVTSGGQVMKNVTGLDLVKLSAGAMGTLGIMTEVTFKVLPVPQTSATLVFEGLSAKRAIGLMCAAMGSPFEVSGAAYVGATGMVVLRLEGFKPSVAYRLTALDKWVAAFGSGTSMARDGSQALWTGIRDLGALDAPSDGEVWRVHVAPSRALAVVSAIEDVPGARLLMDWGGGLIWAAAPEASALELVLRPILARLGGHAVFVRGSDARRRTVPVYPPLSPPLMALTRGIKLSLDPHRIFNRGRMYEGI